MPVIKENPDRIIKDCTDVIEHLRGCKDVESEQSEAHYYMGMAFYNKGVVDIDKGCLGNAEYYFSQVACNRKADPYLRAMALYSCGVCWGKLRNDEQSKDYFEKALNEFDTITNNPGTDYDMRARALHYCSKCCDDLGYDQRAESYSDKAEESGFCDEPQLHYLGVIVQKSEDLKNRVMGHQKGADE